MYSLATWQVCYRHIVDVHTVDVHEEFIGRKEIFLTNLQHFQLVLDNFRPLYILTNG